MLSISIFNWLTISGKIFHQIYISTCANVLQLTVIKKAKKKLTVINFPAK